MQSCHVLRRLQNRNIWQTMLKTIHFFFEKLMYLEILSVSARIEDLGSIFRSPFRFELVLPARVVPSLQILCFLKGQPLLLLPDPSLIVAQFSGTISSPSQQSANITLF